MRPKSWQWQETRRQRRVECGLRPALNLRQVSRRRRRVPRNARTGGRGGSQPWESTRPASPTGAMPLSRGCREKKRPCCQLTTGRTTGSLRGSRRLSSTESASREASDCAPVTTKHCPAGIIRQPLADAIVRICGARVYESARPSCCSTPIGAVQRRRPACLLQRTSCVNLLGMRAVRLGGGQSPHTVRGHIPPDPLAKPSRRWRAAHKRQE
jgi:hypothetical protein